MLIKLLTLRDKKACRPPTTYSKQITINVYMKMVFTKTEMKIQLWVNDKFSISPEILKDALNTFRLGIIL